ncbi:Vacuolar protein sorting-associated protein 41 [Amphibalanus amphitrite]|uniref:Vacuolar protein sorting-associated protein 41 homolog n=1 Tax=Amphibalanus amphitrite TaxID=1232801 RepID=A0A6A4VMW0_AMPAM|nr:vacuolar protein sorting-associated protein 41 homolog [Amphibalanus amphitrite]XP_043242816.1 vacuolar protein sorting-associated protein 41 homolog [Amphibalanus amphitrite]KAF0294963.1 Vacuolar protein sorting-associated protein 41 [Amphibalanus amphitrite]
MSEGAAAAAAAAAAALDDADSIGEYSGSLDSDSSEEPADEPHLKYERMGSDLALLLAAEPATCLCVHPKLVLVGTGLGRVHVFDHLGNRVRPARQPHTLCVNEISADEAGEHVASCSDDGTVCVHGLYSRDNSHSLTFDAPVKTVVLDPQYSRPGTGRRFAVGDSRVVLHEKTFLTRLRATTIHEGDGTVQALSWRGPLLAWASNGGVRVYHTELKRVISLIRCDVGERPANHRCHLFWRDPRRLLVGWRRCVQMAVVREPRDAEARASGVGTHMEITHIFRTEFLVCGLAGCGDELVLLTQSETGGSGPRPRPQVRVIRPLPEDYEELSTDELTVRGFQNFSSNQYRLDCLADEGTFFVLAPSDVIVARPRDTDDHIEWLLEHHRFEEALRELQAAGPAVRRHCLQDVGRKYLDSLLQEEQYETAASLCHTIFGRNRTLWEEEVYRFAALRQLKAISGYLPRGDFHLDSTVYEMVLYNFMRTDQAEFLRLVREWSPSLYHCDAVVNAALEQLLHDADNPCLLQALGLLYTHQCRHDKALAIYLKLGHPGVFDLVTKHELHAAVADRAAALARVDEARTVELLTERPEESPPERVVAELTALPAVLYRYLWRLYQRHRHLSGKYHDRLVELSAEYERGRLMELLRASGEYSLQRALHVCQTRMLIPETVYLLGRTGATREALQLIMNQLADIKQAIAFCKEHDDSDLWDDLINYCLDQPVMVKELLLNIGTHVDPRRLIRRIEDGLAIPGLRDALVQILHDYKVQVDLQDGCRRILVSDRFQLHARLQRCGARAVPVGAAAACCVCGGGLLHRDPAKAADLVTFYCRHAFHRVCLPAARPGACIVCRNEPRGRLR